MRSFRGVAYTTQKLRLYLRCRYHIHKIAELLGLGEEKTLLGVDAVKDGKLVGRNLNEQELLHLLKNTRGKKAKILVSLIGAQGFIFGRGNQQLSAKVIEKVGVENMIVLATPHKLSETPFLLVDTGSEERMIREALNTDKLF